MLKREQLEGVLTVLRDKCLLQGLECGRGRKGKEMEGERKSLQRRGERIDTGIQVVPGTVKLRVVERRTISR